MDRQYSICSCTGKTAKVSMPYRSGETPVWTETQYDGIGRVRKVIPPDGTASANFVEYRYGATQIGDDVHQVRAVFDAKGVGLARVYDAEGQLVQVREDVDYATLNSSTTTEYVRRPDSSYLSGAPETNPCDGGGITVVGETEQPSGFTPVIL